MYSCMVNLRKICLQALRNKLVSCRTVDNDIKINEDRRRESVYVRSSRVTKPSAQREKFNQGMDVSLVSSHTDHDTVEIITGSRTQKLLQLSNRALAICPLS